MLKKFVNYVLLISYVIVSLEIIKVATFIRWLLPSWRDWLDLALIISLVGIFIILTGFVMAALS